MSVVFICGPSNKGKRKRGSWLGPRKLVFRIEDGYI